MDRDCVRFLSPFTLDASSIKLVANLKSSMASHLRANLPTEVRVLSKALAGHLADRFNMIVPSAVLAFAIFDEGLVHRVEFQVPENMIGNARFALVGDAALTASIVRRSFEVSHDVKTATQVRSEYTSRKNLSLFYNRYFFVPEKTAMSLVYPFLGPLTWEYLMFHHKPTDNQKAEFVEALLGVLSLAQPLAYAILVQSIVTFCNSRTNVVPKLQAISSGDLVAPVNFVDFANITEVSDLPNSTAAQSVGVASDESLKLPFQELPAPGKCSCSDVFKTHALHEPLCGTSISTSEDPDQYLAQALVETIRRLSEGKAIVTEAHPDTNNRAPQP